MAETEYG